jgi:hypothetical protein
MSEFEFLDRMFNRLREARGFQHERERGPGSAQKTTARQDAWKVATVMIEYSIRDYLALRGDNKEPK